MSSAASAAASSAAAASGIPFLSSVPVSAALLVIGIVLFVVMCYKGIHTAVSAIIASAIVALGSSTGFLDTAVCHRRHKTHILIRIGNVGILTYSGPAGVDFVCRRNVEFAFGAFNAVHIKGFVKADLVGRVCQGAFAEINERSERKRRCRSGQVRPEGRVCRGFRDSSAIRLRLSRPACRCMCGF